MGRRIEELNRFILGWMGYFRLVGTPSVFRRVDAWLRRRLRQVRWKEWKLPKRRVRALKSLGIPAAEAHQWGVSSRGHWRMARSTALSVALPGVYWDNLGLPRLFQLWQRFNQAA